MALKKKKKFNLTFGVFVRLALFFIVVYLSINYLSSNKKNDPTVLGDETTNIDLKPYANKLYEMIPSKSRSQIENLPQRINLSLPMLRDFPQKQIKEIQVLVVKNVSDIIIKRIGETK